MARCVGRASDWISAIKKRSPIEVVSLTTPHSFLVGEKKKRGKKKEEKKKEGKDRVRRV